MSGTGGELPEAHGPKFPAEGLLADRNAELVEHPLRQINQPPADHAMSRRYRARFNDPHQSPPLLVAQERRVARRLAVHEAGRPLRVEGQYPVPDRLQPDTTDLGGLGPRPAVIDRSQRQQAPGLIGIGRPLPSSRNCTAS